MHIFAMLLLARLTLGYKSFYDVLDAQVVLPDKPDITGEVSFNYTDPSRANENMFVAKNNTETPGGGVGNATDPDSPFGLLQILSPDGKAVVFATTSGNLHMKALPTDGISVSDKSMYFNGDPLTGRVFFDQNLRFFHYYAQTMDSYGISRLRLHNETHVPDTGRMVSLFPLATPNHPSGARSLLVAATAENKIFYIAACNLKDQYTKLFLFKSYPDGLQKLKSVEMQSVVTGGEAQECVMVAVTTGANGYTAAS